MTLDPGSPRSCRINSSHDLPLPTGHFGGSGDGKLAGATQLVKLGEIETSIVPTGTFSAFRAAASLVGYLLGLSGYEELTSVTPIVGETNDGFLSDIHSRPITRSHVLDALSSASFGPFAEGAVGAGTGTSALGFKGGIGTSSRVVEMPGSPATATLGVLVQSNFSGTLTVLGVPIDAEAASEHLRARSPAEEVERGNSCMIVVATDAMLDADQLRRLATRAVFGMSRVGAGYTHGSGDYGIAFSVGEERVQADADLDPLFVAVQEAVEEALLNSLFMAETMVGYRLRATCGASRCRAPRSRRAPHGDARPVGPATPARIAPRCECRGYVTLRMNGMVRMAGECGMCRDPAVISSRR